MEINNANYEVERSTDGRNWIKIATVLPVPSHEYDYTDNAVAAGLYYYRIKQVDTNGSYNYSIIRVIKLNGDTRLSIWPNPVTNILFVQSNFTKGRFEITDASGKIIKKEIINNTLTTVPLQHLAKGIYTIRLYYNGGMFVEKFIKQ
ncbi:T9SS type A sorting domain-containing protein [Ginsengibacter hankyongi]|uniref:T9SS type A sorting domain-containing protein n=1 Tax=Ginsengibacter hankyongi TaxID=2607284 RepID=UPI001925B673|nr:T9SS type A sorting domain-containing protein [Ginsengibacter hankyongi]